MQTALHIINYTIGVGLATRKCIKRPTIYIVPLISDSAYSWGIDATLIMGNLNFTHLSNSHLIADLSRWASYKYDKSCWDAASQQILLLAVLQHDNFVIPSHSVERDEISSCCSLHCILCRHKLVLYSSYYLILRTNGVFGQWPHTNTTRICLHCPRHYPEGTWWIGRLLDLILLESFVF